MKITSKQSSFVIEVKTIDGENGTYLFFRVKTGEWRRGDSNPKSTETETLHNHANSVTECNEKPLEGHSVEQNHNSSEHFETLSQHELGANMVREDWHDPDLVDIVKVWPELPEHIKAAIKALIQTHNTEGK